MKAIYTILSNVKSLKTSLYEGLLKGQKSTLDNGDEAIVSMIYEYIESNYHISGKLIISKKPNKDGLYVVSSDSDIIACNYDNIVSLTNDLFVWGVIYGRFVCSHCKSLKSLEGAPARAIDDFDCSCCESLKSLKGAPEYVGGDFSCSNCNSLESLDGCPKTVVGDFSCGYCKSLKSLKGAPYTVGKNFDCSHCKSLKSLDGCPKTIEEYFSCGHCESLKSLEGAPKTVGRSFDCCYCKSLTSLEGAPYTVGGSFMCYDCGKSFVKNDIKKESKINGDIYC